MEWQVGRNNLADRQEGIPEQTGRKEYQSRQAGENTRVDRQEGIPEQTGRKEYQSRQGERW